MCVSHSHAGGSGARSLRLGLGKLISHHWFGLIGSERETCQPNQTKVGSGLTQKLTKKMDWFGSGLRVN